jgi:methylenetetrahydrofolate reductase (NADPH)
MSLLRQIFAPGRFGLSFELFPPKTPEGEAALYQNLAELAAFKPDFVTCTYGAGGSTRSKTLEIICEVKKRHALPVASHLTCVGSTKDQLRAYLRDALEKKIDFIVALRGDPPKGETTFTAVEGGLRYANELVAMLRAEFPTFGLLVAGYPETHQEAISPEVDLDNLKRKVDAGAEIVVTQLFYDNADFFRFRDRCAAKGIRIPIVPGLLPVTNLAQIQRITSLCKACLPEDFVAKLKERDDADWQFQVGIEQCTRQAQELIDAGAPGIHFYVLNKSHATAGVLKSIRRPV